MRGSPEYFDSLKSNQPLQDELERYKRQNQQLEAQRHADAQELQRFRVHMENQRQEFDRKFLSMDDALARKVYVCPRACVRFCALASVGGGGMKLRGSTSE